MKLFIFTLYAFLLSNCSLSHNKLNSNYENPNKKLDNCIKALYSETKNSDDFKEIQKTIKDTITKWVSLKLPFTEIFQPENYFMDSIVYFNGTKNQCALLFNFKQQPYSKHFISQIIAGEKINNKWLFYYSGELSIVCRLNIPSDSSSSSYVLSGRQCFIPMFLKPNSCVANQKLFDEFLINTELRERHVKFLHGISY